MSPDAVLAAALRAHGAGLCVAPPREDGSKAPDAIEWKTRQTIRPNTGEICAVYSNGRTGLGIVCGAVSGGLELFEVEDRVTWDALRVRANETGLSALLTRIEQGYLEEAPRGGVHLFYFCDAPRTAKLARRPKRPDEQRDPHDKVQLLIETKGEGGYAIVAPSYGGVHPSGRPYVLLQGGFDSIVRLTNEEREALHDLARSFDQLGPEKAQRRESEALPPKGTRVGDYFNATTTWAELLQPAGWVRVVERDGVTHWRRPGKRDSISATTNYAGSDRLYVFSTSTLFEAERSYDRFGAYAVLHHGGDVSAAARELGKQIRNGEQSQSRTTVGEAVDDVTPEELAALLDRLADVLRKYVVLPVHALTAISLWIVHTYLHEQFDSTPYLAVTSAEKRSGKTRLLEVLELLVFRPLRTFSISVAALFRQVEEVRPTVLFDEVDAIWGSREKAYEELRALINAGHRRGAKAIRCVGEGTNQRVHEYSVFCPKVLAGIGSLPDTVQDRAISIRMKRRARNESVARFRLRDARQELAPLAKEIEDISCRLKLSDDRPEIPAALGDRQADGWEPLLAIAERAGEVCAKRARDAAVRLAGQEDHDAPSLGIRLLADLRTLFAQNDGRESLFTQAILAGLRAMEEAPWGGFGKDDKALDARRLAALLRAYEVRPGSVRNGEETGKGYKRADLEDAWERYLDPEHPEPGRFGPAPAPPSAQDGAYTSQRHNGGLAGTGASDCDGVTDREPVGNEEAAAHEHQPDEPPQPRDEDRCADAIEDFEL